MEWWVWPLLVLAILLALAWRSIGLLFGFGMIGQALSRKA